MPEVQVWPTGYLAEEYLGYKMHRFHGEATCTMLVGVKSLREHFIYKESVDNGGTVFIAEPFAANYEFACANYPDAVVVHGTVQEALALHPWMNNLVWLQGPEHVDKATAIGILEQQRVRGVWVVAEMPHGIHEQGPDGGNELERHVAYFYPHDFDPMLWGRAVGPENKPREESPTVNQHLLVWSL